MSVNYAQILLHSSVNVDKEVSLLIDPEPQGFLEEEMEGRLCVHFQRCLKKHNGIHTTELTGLWKIRHVGFRNNHLSPAFHIEGLKASMSLTLNRIGGNPG